MNNSEKPQAADLTDEAARELLEVARLIEDMASRAAEQLESTFFSYAKELRGRAQRQLAGSPRMAGDYIIEDDYLIDD